MELHEFFLGPIKLAHNEKVGRHYVATRKIQSGEIILKERPIASFPWSSDGSAKVICCSCYQKLHEYSWNKCSQCKWPVCDSVCAKDVNHANFECNYLEKNGIPFEPAKSSISYIWIQTLRTLLLFESNQINSNISEKIQSLESHAQIKTEIEQTAKIFASAIDFIQNKCGLVQFDEATIKHALGVIDVNAFSCPGNDKCGCALYLEASIFSHDCSPNARPVSKIEGRNSIFLKFEAIKEIEEGEIVSLCYYASNAGGVIERRARLKNGFHFECECQKCQNEMRELEQK